VRWSRRRHPDVTRARAKIIAAAAAAATLMMDHRGGLVALGANV